MDNADVFRAATVEERRRAVATLVERLGTDWTAEELDPNEDCLPLLHRSTDVRFVAVPGGNFEMGLSDADLEEASEHINWTSHVASTVLRLSQVARPVHTVNVSPFLCTRALLTVEQITRLSHGHLDLDSPERDDACSLARDLGFRLPSEAELEWLARDGGVAHFMLDVVTRPEQSSLFGIQELFFGEWAEDDWHPTYDGAPAMSEPWYDGEPCGVYRAGYPPEQMQSNEEMLFALAGVRGKGMNLPTFVGMRLATHLPLLALHSGVRGL